MMDVFKLSRDHIELFSSRKANASQLAEIIGTSPALVLYHLKKLKIDAVQEVLRDNSAKARSEKSKSKHGMIEKMLMDGKSYLDITTELHVSHRTVTLVRNQLSLPIPKKVRDKKEKVSHVAQNAKQDPISKMLRSKWVFNSQVNEV